MSLRRKAGAGLTMALAALAVSAPAALAETDPVGCTPTIEMDPSIPTWTEVNGDSLAGSNSTGIGSRHLTADLYEYQAAIVAATANNPRVRVIEKTIGETVLGTFNVPGQQRELKYVVVGTPENIANLDEGRDDAAFWSGVVAGRVPASEALTQVRSRPAFAWATATPHGNEPVAGEALMRQLYELVARLDCANARRLRNLDVFIDPARNPDGRDNNFRTTAWGYDPNRDFGTRNQPENRQFMPEITKYPGLFFIDAHQQTSGYFFPPNQDPVHHEISGFAVDMINNRVGPRLQEKFNDQSSAYRNYDTYDLFAPIFGDSVPSLIMGGGGMTFEKGTTEPYGKQIYDHYLAIDETINLASESKVELLTNWVGQWQEAIDQGQNCALQQNKLYSPVNLGEITQQPNEAVCGYFYKPGEHSGDVATLVDEMVSTGVQIYRLDQAFEASDAHVFGTPKGTRESETLPAGTLWIPLAQPMKHWIQAVLGEDPFIPFTYYYDVVSWSYNLNRIGAGAGMLTQQMPSATAMTQINAANFGSAPSSPQAVYAFNTDSMQALGMITELLDKGVVVSRSKSAFTSGGREFLTGTALVDGPSLAEKNVDIAQIANQRDTPVYGLPSYPGVARFAMQKPKIGVYTNTATAEPTNPLRPNGGTGHCGNTAAYCSALFVLTQKDRVPGTMVLPVTQADLTGGKLVSEGFTAFVNPGNTIAAGPMATAVQTFVNGGGRYLGMLAGGTTTARNAGITRLDATPMTTTGCGSRTVITSTTCFGTPGSTFIAGFDTNDPVAWGHDRGGFVYRDASSNPAYDPATLTGNQTIPNANAAISFTAAPKALGFERNAATGDARLTNRPAVVNQPFGSGRAILFGFDPFFRAWHEGSERVVLNALLHPTGAEIPAPVQERSASKPQPVTAQAVRRATEPVAEPVPAAELPAVRSRPITAVPDTSRDVWVEVARSDAKALRGAVRKAKLPKHIKARGRFSTTRRSSVFYVRNGAEAGGHRPHWAGRIVGALRTYRVKPTGGKLG